MLRLVSRLGVSRAPLSAYGGVARAYATRTPPAELGEGEKVIYDKLNARFPGERLEVQDVSGEEASE